MRNMQMNVEPWRNCPLVKRMKVDDNSSLLEKMFIEAFITSDPSTFREQVYAVKEDFDTTSDKDCCAADLSMWENFTSLPCG